LDTTSADNGGTIIVSGSKRWKRVFDGAVNVTWFGAKGDWDENTSYGTDDTVSLQAAINYFTNNECVLEFPANRVFKTSSDIIGVFSTVYESNNRQKKRKISGGGSKIYRHFEDSYTFGDTDRNASVIKFMLTGAASIVTRYVTIEGLNCTSRKHTLDKSKYFYAEALTILGNDESFFYNWVVRDCIFNAYVGLAIYGTFFESTIQDNHILATELHNRSDISGVAANDETNLARKSYGIYIDTREGYPQNTAPNSVISSITLFQNTTRYGENGIYISPNTPDINVIGGTYLQANKHGIVVKNAHGNYIKGAHVEGNWNSNLNIGFTDGNAGILVYTGSNYAVEDIFSVCTIPSDADAVNTNKVKSWQTTAVHFSLSENASVRYFSGRHSTYRDGVVDVLNSKSELMVTGNAPGIRTGTNPKVLVTGNPNKVTNGNSGYIGVNYLSKNTYFSSQPTLGKWSYGSIVYNTNPVAGGNIGWVCVTGGTSERLIGVTGSVIAGQNVVTLNVLVKDTTIVTGSVVIVGGYRRIVSGFTDSTLILNAVITVGLSNVEVNYTDPEWKTFGAISV
jgi:hypothetical protein